MWARNLLFLSTCGIALLAFRAALLPPEEVPATRSPGSNSAELLPIVEQVDQAFARSWQAQGLTPAPQAADLAVARRLSLALTGTIPSLEELRRFEAQPEEGRLDAWVSALLSDRRAADYMAERLARAYVGVDDGPFLLFRRRRFVAWLADQLHENRRYDGLVRQLISESGLWTDRPATNFVTVAIKPDSDEDPDPVLLAGRVSRAFLGIRLDCAECHDHPFEEWKQADFQRLAAFFAQTNRSCTGIRDGKGEFRAENHETGQESIISPGVPYQHELLPTQGSRRQRLAHWVTHRDNRAFAETAVNRAWALLFGRPLVEPIDNIPPDGDRPGPLKLLADDFVKHDYNWRRLLRVIAATRVFRLDSAADPAVADHQITDAHVAAWAAFPITRLRPEQVVGGLLQAASLETIDYQSHILVRVARQLGQQEFIARYGDSGSDEFELHGGTIPQRLLMMNGELVRDKTKDDLVGNAAARIAQLAPTDARAVETAMLCVLTRRPGTEEMAHFCRRLQGTTDSERSRRLEDLYWTLLNSTEFSWNH